jgi:hypothetical protein
MHFVTSKVPPTCRSPCYCNTPPPLPAGHYYHLHRAPLFLNGPCSHPRQAPSFLTSHRLLCSSSLHRTSQLPAAATNLHACTVFSRVLAPPFPTRAPCQLLPPKLLMPSRRWHQRAGDHRGTWLQARGSGEQAVASIGRRPWGRVALCEGARRRLRLVVVWVAAVRCGWAAWNSLTAAVTRSKPVEERWMGRWCRPVARTCVSAFPLRCW